MRDRGQDISTAKERVRRLIGIRALIKIKGPRGKIETAYGQIVSTFPAVFTVAMADGTSRTFSYADVLTGNILFLDPTKK